MGKADIGEGYPSPISRREAISETDLQAFLQRSFDCSPDTALAICRAARRRVYGPRGVLVRQGDVCTETFLLVVGHARAAIITTEGRLVRLVQHSPGDVFGAIGLDLQHVTEVTAISAVDAAVFAVQDFFALAQVHACLGLALSRSLVRQLAELSRMAAARFSLSATGRVHAELLRLARASGDLTIRPGPVIAELAEQVQTSRETASRAISALERRGIILRESGALIVVAPRRLEALIV